MSNSPDFIAHLLDLLSGGGLAQVRPMFGGHGLYVDRLFVGIVVDDVLYLKADGETSARFTGRGLEPFRYARGGGDAALGFYRAPDEALEDSATMREWIVAAKGAAARAAAAKPRGDRPPRAGSGRSEPTIVRIRTPRGPGARITGSGGPRGIGKPWQGGPRGGGTAPGTGGTGLGSGGHGSRGPHGSGGGTHGGGDTHGSGGHRGGGPRGGGPRGGGGGGAGGAGGR